VLVDNASAPPLAAAADIGWHPAARVVREERLGLTWARLRGFGEARGDWVVLVDDDNVLAADYLERAWRIAEDNPSLGVFGGRIDPEFEFPPPLWTQPYWMLLAIRPKAPSRCSHELEDYDCMPCGAGMCLRRDVAARYSGAVLENPVRGALDRAGSSLVSSGDNDLVMTALSLGHSMGRYDALELTHLISSARLTFDYLRRLHEGNGYSETVLSTLWPGRGRSSLAATASMTLRVLWRTVASGGRGFFFVMSWRKGVLRARADIVKAGGQTGDCAGRKRFS
jgi:glycosyltransferase involved in cell wall biosynthesis